MTDTPAIADATVRAAEGTSLRALLRNANGPAETAKAAKGWYESTRAGRAMARMVTARGNLLAGGIAYAAVFSLFAALAIGWTVFMAVLGGNAALRDQLVTTINEALPGIIDTGDGGLVSPDQLVLDTALTVTSVVAALVLLWSALAMMTALKASIRRMFGVVAVPENFVVKKVRDLAGFVVLAVATLLTSVSSIGANTLGSLVFDWLGMDGPVSAFLLRAGTFLAGALVDFAVFAFLFRAFAGMRVPRRDLVLGAAIGALASAALRVLGTSVLGASSNPLLASATALVTILLWLNLIARITLMVAAFTANPPAPLKPSAPEEVHFGHEPNYVTLTAPETLQWAHQATTGTLEPDPRLNPNRPPDPVQPEPVPRRGGLIGWLKRRRIERLDRRLAAARESYYR